MFPEIGGAIAAGIEWITSSAMIAKIEGEEVRAKTFEPSGHFDVAAADGEMD